MTQNEHEQNLALARQVKEAADDMEVVANELKKLPKGQYKKLWENENLTQIFKKWGVLE